LEYYKTLQTEAGYPPGENYERLFWKCAVQRLMQALGAYGFLSIHRGKPSFRAHVAPALTRLREALSNLHPEDRQEEVEEVLKKLKAAVTDAKQRPGQQT
jgi:hypothetical protein